MPKVSAAMLVICGLVGPKLRLKSVSDGLQVNIPVLFNNRYELWRDGRCTTRVSIGRHESSKVEVLGKSGTLFSDSSE